MDIVVVTCSQQQVIAASLTSRLDSIRMGNGRERYFGELYLHSTRLVEDYIQDLPPVPKSLMARLEEKFAAYFFSAVDAYNHGHNLPGVWHNYFSQDLSPLQLKLVGANAHINGDLWQVLANSFTHAELKLLKPYYKRYGFLLTKEFNQLFEFAKKEHKGIRRLHIISLGFDKVYGRLMLRKWRNRQMSLAKLGMENSSRFSRRQNLISKKRKRIDRMIVRRLHS